MLHIILFSRRAWKRSSVPRGLRRECAKPFATLPTQDGGSAQSSTRIRAALRHKPGGWPRAAEPVLAVLDACAEQLLELRVRCLHRCRGAPLQQTLYQRLTRAYGHGVPLRHAAELRG